MVYLFALVFLCLLSVLNYIAGNRFASGFCLAVAFANIFKLAEQLFGGGA